MIKTWTHISDQNKTVTIVQLGVSSRVEKDLVVPLNSNQNRRVLGVSILIEDLRDLWECFALE